MNAHDNLADTAAQVSSELLFLSRLDFSDLEERAKDGYRNLLGRLSDALLAAVDRDSRERGVAP